MQPRTSVPTGPVIEQLAPPVTVPSVQSTPAGSGSLTATPSAVPVPVFVTVMSKPIGSPALTGPSGFATFAMAIVAGATVKHSLVALVCVPARYCEAASGVYSARQQYLPTAADVNPTV